MDRALEVFEKYLTSPTLRPQLESQLEKFVKSTLLSDRILRIGTPQRGLPFQDSATHLHGSAKFCTASFTLEQIRDGTRDPFSIGNTLAQRVQKRVRHEVLTHLWNMSDVQPTDRMSRIMSLGFRYVASNATLEALGWDVNAPNIFVLEDMTLGKILMFAPRSPVFAYHVSVGVSIVPDVQDDVWNALAEVDIFLSVRGSTLTSYISRNGVWVP